MRKGRPSKENKNDSVTLEEAKLAFEEYYNNRHSEERWGSEYKKMRYNAKLQDKSYQKKPEKTLKPDTPGSIKYVYGHGPRTFDMEGVDHFEEGVEFIVDETDELRRKSISKGETDKSRDTNDTLYGPRTKSGKLFSEINKENYQQKSSVLNDSSWLIKKRWDKKPSKKFLQKKKNEKIAQLQQSTEIKQIKFKFTWIENNFTEISDCIITIEYFENKEIYILKLEKGSEILKLQIKQQKYNDETSYNINRFINYLKKLNILIESKISNDSVYHINPEYNENIQLVQVNIVINKNNLFNKESLINFKDNDTVYLIEEIEEIEDELELYSKGTIKKKNKSQDNSYDVYFELLNKNITLEEHKITNKKLEEYQIVINVVNGICWIQTSEQSQKVRYDFFEWLDSVSDNCDIDDIIRNKSIFLENSIMDSLNGGGILNNINSDSNLGTETFYNSSISNNPYVIKSEIIGKSINGVHNLTDIIIKRKIFAL